MSEATDRETMLRYSQNINSFYWQSDPKTLISRIGKMLNTGSDDRLIIGIFLLNINLKVDVL